ncbi:hypothetical protein HHL11_25480 [Ramlibacter sp. G-1-2-2]|uniref:Aldose 1-epimerase n=1 Tax=Ramlibacter agri TaxID=2728837 RepID=A0A848HF16_9BURK|nr:hypothetical protein [Ramlibacter agri]NML47123.1 hypothetical protein [Ramlibacter agri]
MALLSGDGAIELRSGRYTARVVPGAGGRIAALACEGVPLLVEWDGARFDEHHWPKAGAFPMLPFANRLPPEGFTFGGRQVRPTPGPAGFAVHGFGHRKPWQVLEASQQHVQMECVHAGGEEDWPWAFRAAQEVRLADDGLHVHLSVRNDSTEAMPLAMGLHPYHPVPVDAMPADLHFEAAGRHELCALGRAAEAPVAPGFGMCRGETAAFSGWTGSARFGHATDVRCAGVEALVLHRPARGDYLCIEPVTLLPGRLGALALAPGETRSLSWSCSRQATKDFLETT